MIQVVGIAINVVLLLTAWWGARFIFHQRGGAPQILSACTLAWTWCVLGMQFLGVFSRLNLTGISVWVGCGLAIVAICGWTVRSHEDGSGIDHGRGRRDEPTLSWPALLCLTLLIWVCLEMAMQSLLYPVKVMSDGPIYHLYFAVRWWKAGGFFAVAAPFGENAATYFPANGDLWFTWLMILWDGDRLARIGQAPFLVVSGLTAYQLARDLGAGRSSSVIATTWFLTSTPLLVFSFEANVDTIFIAGYLLAAYFFLRFARGEDGLASLVLGGLAAGAALGTKSVAIVFVPPLLVLALLAASLRPGTARTRATRIIAVILTPLVLSGFWYSRNAYLTGNPLYPLQVELLGRTILTGWYGPGAMEQSQYYIPVSNWRALGDILVGVLDPRLVPIWFLALVGVWAIPRPARPAQAKWIWIVAFMAAANIALYWLLIPYRTQQRFMLQALGLAVVPLAQTLERWKWARVVATFLLVLHVVTPQTWPIVVRKEDPIPWDLTPMLANFLPPPLTISSTIGRAFAAPDRLLGAIGLVVPISLGLLSGFVAWSWSRRVSGNPLKRLAMPLVSTALLAMAGYFAYSPGRASPRQLFYPFFPDFHAGWMALDAASGPTGSRVAYAGTNIPYYLFGAGLRNEVFYVNVDRNRNWLLHDYHREAASRGTPNWPNSRPGWDRMQPDYDSWLANLDAERVGLLVVTRVNPAEGAHNVADVEGFPIERRWADTHPGRFQMLYGARERDPWFRLYRLLRPKS